MRDRFRELHRSGIFLMPNPWDVGTARFLAAMGFPALATTSAGHAFTLGRRDQHVTRNELLRHVDDLASAVDVPLNVDSESCFPYDPGGVAETARLLSLTGAAGFSIEDFDSREGALLPLAQAQEQVGLVAEVAKASGMTLTARAENHVYGINNIDDTIERLLAFRQAGADVVYAPWLKELADIERVVREVDLPVNVLSLNGGPTVAELERVGVRRVSTGGAITRAAFTTLDRAARELLDQGTSTYLTGSLSTAELGARLEQPSTG